MDFGHAVRVSTKLHLDTRDVDIDILYDFISGQSFYACYLPLNPKDFQFLSNLFSVLSSKQGDLKYLGKYRLPSKKQFPGTFTVKNEPQFEINAQHFGDSKRYSSSTMKSPTTIYLYTDAQPGKNADYLFVTLADIGKIQGMDVHIRNSKHAMRRNEFEKPRAYICHDSNDREVVRKLAGLLNQWIQPVWHDEFSLSEVGSLREVFARGQSECRTCILLFSPQFISNPACGRKEFESVFTRDILENPRLVLPVWYKTTEKMALEYSPHFSKTKGFDWDVLGDDELCTQLCRSVVDM